MSDETGLALADLVVFDVLEELPALHDLHHDVHVFVGLEVLLHAHHVGVLGSVDDLDLVAQELSLLGRQLLLVDEFHCEELLLLAAVISQLALVGPAQVDLGELALAQHAHALEAFRHVEEESVLHHCPDPLLRNRIVRVEVLLVPEVLRVVVHAEAFHALVEEGLDVEPIEENRVYENR
jgi:hypothetical protein